MSFKTPVCGIPQIRIRFPGDRPVLTHIADTVGLYDVTVSLSVPAARQLLKELKDALKEVKP